MTIYTGYWKHTIILAFILSFFQIGCGNKSSLERPDSPCDTDQGLYAKITGDSFSTVFCIADDDVVNQTDIGVQAFYSQQSSSYMISATFTANDTLHEILLGFKIQPQTPAVLSVTANQAAGQADPGSIWLYYRFEDLGPGGKTFQTIIASGTVTVTFNDDQVAVAAFQDIDLTLEDISNPSHVISMQIEEGYFNITSDAI